MATICGFQISSVGVASLLSLYKKRTWDIWEDVNGLYFFCSSHSHSLFDIVLYCLSTDLPRKFRNLFGTWWNPVYLLLPDCSTVCLSPYGSFEQSDPLLSLKNGGARIGSHLPLF